VPEVAPDLPWPDPPSWSRAIAASPLDGTALHWEEGLLYLDRYWREETEVVEELRRRAAAPPPTPDGATLDAALAAHFPGGSYADQRAAAETACRRWTTV